MRFTIDVEEGVQPISGRLHRLGETPVEFTGMIELIAILDRVSGRAQPADTAGGDSEPGRP
jgi:hypothetical protein